MEYVETRQMLKLSDNPTHRRIYSIDILAVTHIGEKPIKRWDNKVKL